jgi:predicted ATPase/DNA-binding XRE family transcriptional regulator
MPVSIIDWSDCVRQAAWPPGAGPGNLGDMKLECVSFGDWVQVRRLALDMTREELARGVGCSVSALRKIEGDERRPSRQLAELLADCLRIPGDACEAFLQVARGLQPLERLAMALGDAIPTPLPPPANLPQSATPFVGREAELAALNRLLHTPQSRLVTIIGPGGVGKTRLALAVAANQAAHFGDGVYFVSLAGLATPQFIPEAVADALGFVFSGPIEPQAQLLNYLAPKRLLLMLDNVEHLLAGVELLAEMMQRAPAIKLLATSRERLNLTGEWVFDLQGLPVPPPGQIEEAEAYSGVTLFVQAARRVRADYALTAEELAAVARICRLVEGMPLALELAAAWTRLLNCAEIATEIERGLDFLRSTMRDAPARQHSLRATFDYSWNLLPAAEQRVLSQLAVFQGGFTREAATQVAGATLPDLLSLVSKSLLRRAVDGRFDLHQIIRQYALLHLNDETTGAAARVRHSDYYLALLHRQEPFLRNAAQRETIRTLVDEIDNIRAAWDCAAAQQKFATIGPAVKGFGTLFELQEWLPEGVAKLEMVVQAIRAQTAVDERQIVLGEALAQQALLFFRWGRFDDAIGLLQESLALLRPFDDPALLCHPLVYCGTITHLNGDLEQAHELLTEAMACATAAGNHWFAAWAGFNLGYLASLRGEYEQGYRQMGLYLALWRAIGDPRAIALGINYISPTLVKLGYYAEARAVLEESVTLCRELGNRWGLGTAYRFLGVVALAQNEPAEAEAFLRQSLDVFNEFVTGWDIARSLTYLGDAKLALGDLPAAESIFKEALHLSIEARAVPLVLDALAGFAELAQQAGRHEQALELASFVLAHSASPQSTKERTERITQAVTEALSAEAFRTIQARAAEQSLATITNSLMPA